MLMISYYRVFTFNFLWATLCIFENQGPLLYMWPLQASIIQKDGVSHFLICANVFKFFNQMSPQYTAEIFHPSSSVHNTRRATQKLDIPFRKSCIGQKTLSYIGPKIWNNLPAQIKLSKSVNTFKHDIKKSFFDDLQKQNDDIFFYY